jgi:hypothetical protein
MFHGYKSRFQFLLKGNLTSNFYFIELATHCNNITELQIMKDFVDILFYRESDVSAIFYFSPAVVANLFLHGEETNET